MKMNKSGYRPTNGGYSGSKTNGSKKITVEAHKKTPPPSAPRSGSAQTKFKKVS